MSAIKKTPWEYYAEPMTEETPESVKLLNQYYGAAQTGLDENKALAQQQLDENRRLAHEKNNVAYRTAQKYLPTQNKMNGLSGLGVSQSAYVDMLNRYMTRRGSIDASHASESSNLLQNYTTESNNLFKNYLTERNTAQKEHEQKIKENEQKIKENEQKIYDDAVAIIESGSYNSMEELSDYLHKNVEGKISDSAYNTILQMYERARLDPTNIQRMADEDALRREQAAAGILENYGTKPTKEKFSVTIGGESFADLERGAEETNENLVSLAKDIENGHIFSYDGKVYLKEGDKIYVVDATDETLQKLLGKTKELKDKPWYINPWLNYLI